jgi:pterin-4a-carbinolamine dehydratase
LRDDGHRIERTFRFRNFQEALSFVRDVGNLAETEGHHPDVNFGWGYATISLRTKKSKGLHENDFIMRARSAGSSMLRLAFPVFSEVRKLESWQPQANVLSRFSAEPGFSVAALFGIFV